MHGQLVIVIIDIIKIVNNILTIVIAIVSAVSDNVTYRAVLVNVGMSFFSESFLVLGEWASFPVNSCSSQLPKGLRQRFPVLLIPKKQSPETLDCFVY